MSNINSVYNKIIKFFRISFTNFGKEIAIPSDQFFTINQISNIEKEKAGEYSYYIQYGFFHTGCICLNLSYFFKSNEVKLNNICIYAPEKEKNVSSPIKISEGTNKFLNEKTEKYSTIDEIANNPIAIKLLDLAISDLQQTIVLGEYFSPMLNNNIIPCCSTKTYPHEEKQKKLNLN